MWYYFDYNEKTMAQLGGLWFGLLMLPGDLVGFGMGFEDLHLIDRAIVYEQYDCKSQESYMCFGDLMKGMLSNAVSEILERTFRAYSREGFSRVSKPFCNLILRYDNASSHIPEVAREKVIGDG